MRLQGKHVLITGASGGIGNALAHALLQEGAAVTSLDLKPVDGEQAHQQWKALRVDITKRAQVEKVLKDIPSIDVLINNAGIMRRGTVLESSEEDFDALFSVNVKGSWLLLKLAQPHLAEHAMIVQMCSRHAEHPATDPALYSLTKKCVLDLAVLVAQTYPQYTVKVLCPGPVDTPLARFGVSGEQLQQKMKVMHTPEEVAALIVALLKDDQKTRLTYDEERGTHQIL